MNLELYHAVKELFGLYCLTIDMKTLCPSPPIGKKLSFCFSDEIVMDRGFEEQFLEGRLQVPAAENQLDMAYFRAGQEFFLHLQPILFARSRTWMRLFDGDILGEPQA